MEKTIKKHAEKIRFAIVGGFNTAIDFIVLFLLIYIGVPLIVSNYISTSTALIFSFFVNKKFTFKDASGFNKLKFIKFISITLAGLWILQPLIINLFNSLSDSSEFDNNAIIFLSKLIATVVTLVWNYLLYSRFVFVKGVK